MGKLLAYQRIGRNTFMKDSKPCYRVVARLLFKYFFRYSSLMLLIMGLLFQMAWAQPPDTLWTRIYGGGIEDGASSVIELPGGDLLIAGNTTSFGMGDGDIYLLRTYADGNLRWSRTYGGIYGEGSADLVPTPDGNFVITGATSSYGTANTSAFLFKINAEGDSLWWRTYSSGYYTRGSKVLPTQDGGCIIAGTRVGSTITYFGDFYLLKVDSSGTLEWARSYGVDSLSEWAESVVQTTDGGFILAGYTWLGSAGITELYIVRTDSHGNTLWTRTYGGAGEESACSVLEMEDQRFLVAGTTASWGAGGCDYWLLCLNSTGDTLWTRTCGDNANNRASCLKPLPGGGYLLAGTRDAESEGRYRFQLVRLDENFNVLWQGLYGQIRFSSLTDVIALGDGGFVMAGTAAEGAVPPMNAYVIRTVFDPTTASEVPVHNPATLHLSIFPNPFNSATEIHFELTRMGHISLRVFDVTGREVAILVDQVMPAGEHSISWDAAGVATGVYFLRIQTSKWAQSRRVVLMR